MYFTPAPAFPEGFDTLRSSAPVADYGYFIRFLVQKRSLLI
jgi:hypothetical protein